MTRSSPPPLLLELQNSNSLSGQLAALRALKNELIGAEQRKKSWISLGIIPLLSQILQSRRRHTGKRIDQDANSVQRGAQGAGRVLEDDLCRLQAVEITGSMAQGMMPSFALILHGLINEHSWLPIRWPCAR